MNEKDYGYIKQSRKQFNGEDLLWNDGTPFDTRSAWTWLLQAAAWKDSVYQSRSRMDTLKRGEFVASLRYLAGRWGWDKNTVHRFLKVVQQSGRIEHQRQGRHGHIYLIVNYDAYQDGSPKEGTVKPHAGGTEIGTEKGQHAHKKRDKVERRTALEERTTYSVDFEIFWSAYPKRSGSNPKKRADRAYRARLSEGDTPLSMLEGAQRYAAYVAHRQIIGTEFVQQAVRFLGDEKGFLDPWTVETHPRANGDRLIGVGGLPTAEELASIGIRL